MVEKQSWGTAVDATWLRTTHHVLPHSVFWAPEDPLDPSNRHRTLPRRIVRRTAGLRQASVRGAPAASEARSRGGPCKTARREGKARYAHDQQSPDRADDDLQLRNAESVGGP